MRSLSKYLAARDAGFPAAAPLFVLRHGAALTRPVFNAARRAALGPGFSSHSLRIGLATSACEASVADDTIQRLGRWTSGAFNGHVRCQRPAVGRALRLVSGRAPPPPAP